MLRKVVLIVAALAVVVPSSARADHEVTHSYVSGMLVSISGEDLGVGAVIMDSPGRPVTVTITDNAAVGFLAARACQDIDEDRTLCGPGEPAQDLCVRNGEQVALDGFLEHETYVWIYTTGTGVTAPVCDSSLATTGTVTVGFEH